MSTSPGAKWSVVRTNRCTALIVVPATVLECGGGRHSPVLVKSTSLIEYAVLEHSHR